MLKLIIVNNIHCILSHPLIPYTTLFRSYECLNEFLQELLHAQFECHYLHAFVHCHLEFIALTTLHNLICDLIQPFFNSLGNVDRMDVVLEFFSSSVVDLSINEHAS